MIWGEGRFREMVIKTKNGELVPNVGEHTTVTQALCNKKARPGLPRGEGELFMITLRRLPTETVKNIDSRKQRAPLRKKAFK